MKFLVCLAFFLVVTKADSQRRHGANEDCVQQDCRVVRCGLPTNCTFGVGIPPCGCCPVCLERQDGKACGGPNDSAGNCPNGQVCLDDTCGDVSLLPPFIPRPVGRCFVPCDVATGDEVCRPNCAAVSCLRPEGCQFGLVTPPCSCCPVCAQNPNENECGGPNDSAGTCTNGQVCLSDTCGDVSLLPPFVPRPVGKCFVPCDVATGDEVCRPNCAAVSCLRPEGCQFGLVTPPCSCCPVCAQNSDGNTCGGPNDSAGTCPNGQVCLSDTCINVNLFPAMLPSPIGKCFVPCDLATPDEACRPNCAGTFCDSPPVGCRFGTVIPPCSCCRVCANGPQQEVCGGGSNKRCQKGLECLDDMCQDIRKLPPFLPPPKGRCFTPCDRATGADVCVPDCSTRRCPPLEECTSGTVVPPCECCPVCADNDGGQCTDKKKDCSSTFCIQVFCEFGSVTPPCECCPICLKGPGMPCAGPSNQDGYCGDGLVCVDAELNPIPRKNRGSDTPFGECEKPRGTYSCMRICPAFCPPFDPKECEFGVDSDPCACCGRCAKGLTDSCGGPDNRLGSCAKGLKCVGISGEIIPYNGGTGTRSGRCQRGRRPSKN